MKYLTSHSSIVSHEPICFLGSEKKQILWTMFKEKIKLFHTLQNEFFSIKPEQRQTCYSVCLINSSLHSKPFFSEATQTQLVKHLLKTICTDITNLIVTTVANEHMLSIPDEIQLTPEVSHLFFMTTLPLIIDFLILA